MPQQNPDITKALDRIKAHAAACQVFYDYYEGRHLMAFSSEKFRNKFGKRLQKLRENLCRVVVKAPASRLEVIGFQAEAEEIQKKAWEIWKRNNMPLNAGKSHRESFKTGDGYCIVWPDANGKATIYPQTAAGIACWRNAETGDIEKAAKRWLGSDNKFYLTLYYLDRIEKYVSKNKVEAGQPDTSEFVPREVKGEKFPLVNPFGRVPVFQFSFDEEANDRSNSILTDVIPLNDALNKAYVDIFAAQEANAIRQRWVAGVQFERDDETGKPIIPYDFDSQAWTAEGAEAKFGEFSDAMLEQMLKVKQETVRDIALVSGIPPSYFNLEEAGSAMSGEALRRLEARFIAIVQDAQRSFGDTWGRVMAFALEIEGSMQAGKEIEVQWTDAAPVSETEQLDNAMKKKNLGWSIEQIQRDFGLTDKQIEAMAAETTAKAEADAARQAKMFDAGEPIA